MSWATIFGNLVTDRQVHALLCSDVQIRTRAHFKSLTNPFSKMDTLVQLKCGVKFKLWNNKVLKKCEQHSDTYFQSILIRDRNDKQKTKNIV